jgi:hypothetical protein
MNWYINIVVPEDSLLHEVEILKYSTHRILFEHQNLLYERKVWKQKLFKCKT